MVVTFNEKLERWVDEDNKIVQTPPDALNKNYFPDEDRWRYQKGHPNAGKYAPDPRPKQVHWSRKDRQERFIEKETDEVVPKSTVDSFRESLPESLTKEERKEKVKEKFSRAWLNPKTDELIKQSTAINRNRNKERAEIFKGWADSGRITYQELQQKFKGVPTEEIRGEFIAIDNDTGEVNYAPPSERVTRIKLEIAEEFGVALAPSQQFIDTP